MSLFRVQDKTPEVYTDTSRDFQLIGRLYDCAINGIKFDIDSMPESVCTDTCDSKLLSLLQTKLGFFSKAQIPDDDLRYVLKAFPDILKNKGSLKGIEQAVRVFLKLNHIKSDIRIDVINKSISHPYVIQIGLDMGFKDTLILDEILKYIIPTGYSIAYSFYNDIGSFDINLESKIGANIIVIKDSANSLIRGDYIAYNNHIEDNLIGSIGETQLALPYDSSYMGVVEDIKDLPNYPNPLDEDLGKLYTVKLLDFTKVYNEELSDLSSENYFKSYICIKDYKTNTNVWKELSNDYDYDVFKSAVYGYYLDNNDVILVNNNNDILTDENGSVYVLSKENIKDSFYIDRDSYYNQDAQYSPTGLRITNDSYPDKAVIPAFSNGKLFDKTSDSSWSAIFDFDLDEYVWSKNTFKESGIQILGTPNQANILPKKDMKIYRQSTADGSVSEAIWLAEFYNNSYIWGDIITDQTLIDSYKDDSCIFITGRPVSARIIPKENMHLYNSSTEQSWSVTLSDTNELVWVEDGHTIGGIEIIGSPNAAQIVPNYNVHIYNDEVSWTAIIDHYTNIVDSPKLDVLYIDKDTSNGYRYTGSGFEKVIHFMRASNVYEISREELNFMIENGTLRPAFRDNTTIFKDVYGNVLLL